MHLFCGLALDTCWPKNDLLGSLPECFSLALLLYFVKHLARNDLKNFPFWMIEVVLKVVLVFRMKLA